MRIPYKTRLRWAFSRGNRDHILTKIIVLIGLVTTPTLIMFRQEEIIQEAWKEVKEQFKS